MRITYPHSLRPRSPPGQHRGLEILSIEWNRRTRDPVHGKIAATIFVAVDAHLSEIEKTFALAHGNQDAKCQRSAQSGSSSRAYSRPRAQRNRQTCTSALRLTESFHSPRARNIFRQAVRSMAEHNYVGIYENEGLSFVNG